MINRQSASIFCIIAAEFCERFSFCGLRTILSLYLRNVLCFHENAATVVYHIFIMMCYTMPLMGAILADNFLGRYRVILYFSILYLIGVLLTCASAIPPLMLPPTATSMSGLVLIAMGTGGIKPCVAAFGGDQFRLPEENQRLQQFFSTFYCTVNLGGFLGMVLTPALRRSVMCFGDDACYALGFGFPALLMFMSIIIFVAGKAWYKIKKPRDNVTLKFIACAWSSLIKKLQHDRSVDGPAREHWLDYSVDKYGEKLVADMKVVCSILYVYLPVPIFWSLFDQQGSRWTFQASRLHSEVFGITLLPDQLQVMNPAMVLVMMPFCPGGSCSLLPDLPPLQKMFIGGVLASLAFLAAGILQIGIERSTLQVPGHQHTGLILMNTLDCAIDVEVRGEGVAQVAERGTVLMTPLPHQVYAVTARCPADCAGRVMKKHVVKQQLHTVAGMFMPVIVGQNSDDQISFYFMDPNTFTKSLTGKPKLKVVYIGDTGPNKNVSIAVETDKRLSDIYYVSDAPVDHIGESAYMCLQPGRFKWRAQSASGEVDGSGEGALRMGGVYALCLRERMGRLDAAVLHAPNPPNELNLLWIVPQYILVSIAEIMFAVSGLEFAFTQAPKSMKTITIAAWYVSVAFGNLIVILVAQAKIFESRATEFFVYAAVLMAAMLMFLRISASYQNRSIEVCLVSGCAGMDLDHNCSFSNEMLPVGVYHGYPKQGDMPLLNRKIIRGSRVPILEHPYVVSIRRQMVHYLTGTLIQGNLILTVAHPLVDVPIIELGVVLGQNYNDRGSVLHTVILVIFHEDFDRSTLFADLALVKTYESLEYTVKLTTKPIRSHLTTQFDFENRSVSAFVTGWGRCDITGNELCLPRASKFFRDEWSDPMLRSINIEITENSLHCESYRRHDVEIREGMLCVGPARQADHTCPCLGVPGAPLVVDGRLLGVLSWGFGCGYHTDLPLIYTDVRRYQNWIWRNVKKITSLSEKSFEQLFEVTKIAIISEWLAVSKSVKSEHQHYDTEIQPWKIDKDLAVLDGDIYDIRDYYGRADYHEEKKERYKLIRQSLLEDPRPGSKSKLLEHTTPFALNESFSVDSDDDYDLEYDYDLIQGNPYTNRGFEVGYTYTTTTEPPATDEEYF